jgi:hypothetical protein
MDDFYITQQQSRYDFRCGGGLEVEEKGGKR